MIYSIPYVILVLIYGLLADYYRSTDEAGKSRINMVCIAIFLFFFGFRGFVSHDWVIYYPAFEHVYSTNLNELFNSFGNSVFWGCSSLSTIYYHGKTEPSYGTSTCGCGAMLGSCAPFECSCGLQTVIVPVDYDSSKIDIFCDYSVTIERTLNV